MLRSFAIGAPISLADLKVGPYTSTVAGTGYTGRSGA